MNAKHGTLLASILLIASCAAMRTPKGCDDGDLRAVIESGVSSLSLVAGAAALNSKPVLILQTKDVEGIERNLRLTLYEKEVPEDLSFSAHSCPDLDWAAYDIEIEPTEWNAFFQPREYKNWSIGFGFLQLGVQYTIEEIAFIVYENFSDRPLLICGCAESNR